MDLSFMSDNLRLFMGTGSLFILMLVGMLFLGFRLKKSHERTALVWFPLYVLIVFFCPIWAVYMHLRDDVEILYRILWMIPMAVVVCYAAVELIYLVPKERRGVFFAVIVLLIVLCGQYVYSNRQFHKAENKYHIPQTVIDICEEITVPGREIRACFPIEMIQYVRQYTAYVYQAYGRDNLLWGLTYEEFSNIASIIDDEVLDSEELTSELRRADTPYLIVNRSTQFTRDLADYEFYYVTSYDEYDIYLDYRAYIGID